MNCETVYKILDAIKKREDTKLRNPELEELVSFGLLKVYDQNTSLNTFENQLRELKQLFIQRSSSLRDINKQILTYEGQYSELSGAEKVLSKISLGGGAKIKGELKHFNKIARNYELDLAQIKNQIIEVNAQEDLLKRSVKVNGKRVFITTNGELLLEEIKARKRFFPRELSDLLETLDTLDRVFMALLESVKHIMRLRLFTPIWGVFLLNMDMAGIASDLDKIIRKSSYYYTTAEKIDKKVFREIISHLLPPGTRIPKSSKVNPEFEINSKISKFRIRGREINTIVSELGNLFAIWTDNQKYVTGERDYTPRDDYFHSLDALLDAQEDRSSEFRIANLSPLSEDEVGIATLLLAFSNKPKKYEFFYNKLRDVPEGNKIFSAIAAMFPWDEEETWMVIRRAEANILKKESAKFIPELIEYAILLACNPNVLTVENNITEEELKKWRYITIPAIHIVVNTYIEKKIETYVRTRPLSYIIAPRRYYRSSLHYHRVG